MDAHFSSMATENELSVVLSHYSSEFVFTIVNEQISRVRGSLSVVSTPPNVVAAWETNFKAIREEYSSEVAGQIETVRSETYREIIEIICQAYNLRFTIDDVDLYSSAYLLYDFFVCNLSDNIIKFFAKYIYKERVSIYDSMGLSDMKKNKDSSTIYGKRMYRDIKLAVINANITKVIDNICKSMDFDFNTIVSTVIESKESARYLSTLVADEGNFFNSILSSIVYLNLPEYITGIRFKLQELSIAHDQIIPGNAIPSDDTEINEAEEI